MANNTVATFPGRGIIWGRVKGTLATEPKNIQWGTTAVTGSASANVNLFGPQTEARTAGTSSILTTTQLGDTYQVTGTIVCAVGSKSIQEAGLFDIVSPASPTSTLAASLTASATSMTLGANIGTGVASAGAYYAQVGNETILVTGANSPTLTIARGVLGSTATIQTVGTPVSFGGDGGAGGWTTGQTVNATSIATSYGGNMFIHADFASIALNVNDSVSFTFSDTLT